MYILRDIKLEHKLQTYIWLRSTGPFFLHGLIEGGRGTGRMEDKGHYLWTVGHRKLKSFGIIVCS